MIVYSFGHYDTELEPLDEFEEAQTMCDMPIDEDEEQMKMSKYINLVGNPISGFRVFGPYDDIQEASDAQDGIDEYAIAMEVEDE